MATNLYISGYYDEKRNAELEECLRRNTENPFIDNVIDIQTPAGVRPMFSDFFREIRRFSKPNDINIIANADIYFDETAEKLRRIKSGFALALLRWDIKNGKPTILIHRPECQDVWIFRGLPKESLFGGFCMGLPGCDNRLAHELHAAGYELRNPAYVVRAIHLHESDHRPWMGLPPIPKPYRNVEPDKSTDWME